jgi:hypothetical protein
MNKWKLKFLPDESGWHAVIRCLEPNEGFFPDSAYWNGQEWSKSNIFSHSLNQFDNEHQAKNWAYDNYPCL